ncbi:hypothetical protein GIB67_000969, partial [Kingdonia uniflora]
VENTRPHPQQYVDIELSNDDNSNSFCLHGFGYDDSTQDYMVVGIAYSFTSESYGDIYIYSFQNDLWRTIKKDVPFVYQFADRPMPGLGDEGIRKMSLPRVNSPGNFKVRALEGRLFALFWNYNCGGVDVWVMEEYGIADSWTRLFSTRDFAMKRRCYYDMKLLHATKNGEILIEVDSEHLYLVDIANKTAKARGLSDNRLLSEYYDISNTWSPYKYFDTVIYTACLISLKTGSDSGEKPE